MLVYFVSEVCLPITFKAECRADCRADCRAEATDCFEHGAGPGRVEDDRDFLLNCLKALGSEMEIPQADVIICSAQDGTDFEIVLDFNAQDKRKADIFATICTKAAVS